MAYLHIGFLFALFQTTLLEWPVLYIERNTDQSFGNDTSSCVEFLRRLFDDLWNRVMDITIHAFVLSITVELFDRTCEDVHQGTRCFLLGVLYVGGTLGMNLIHMIRSLAEEAIEVITDFEDEEWVAPIESVCAESGYKMKNVLICHVHEDVRPNAFAYSFFGLYKKIVIYSSIIEDINDRTETWERKRRMRKSIRGQGLNSFELEGVFAHEIGHWVHEHSKPRLIFYFVFLEGIIFMTGLLLTQCKFLYQVFHFAPSSEDDTERVSLPFLPGLFAVQLIVMKWFDSSARSLFNRSSFKAEVQADTYAAAIGRGDQLQMALAKMAGDGLLYPTSDPTTNDSTTRIHVLKCDLKGSKQPSPKEIELRTLLS